MRLLVAMNIKETRREGKIAARVGGVELMIILLRILVGKQPARWLVLKTASERGPHG